MRKGGGDGYQDTAAAIFAEQCVLPFHFPFSVLLMPACQLIPIVVWHAVSQRIGHMEFASEVK